MTGYRDEDDFDVSQCLGEESIIDKINCEKSDIRVRVKTITIIENLLITNTYFSNSVSLRLPISEIIMLCHI